MIPFNIGNWIINEEGIHHTSDPNYIIPVDRLAEPGPQGRHQMYDWLVHMPAKAWVSTEDVYALNTALIYALEHFGIDFPKDLSFVQTFIEQQNELK